MPSSRPKLTLDEQSFQDMLAAAFTIQEHNTRRKKETQPPARACGQCGSPIENSGPLCDRCASEPRQGEELQRKWASLWLMSQEQGLWPDRPLQPETEASAARPPQQIAPYHVPEPLPVSVPSQIARPVSTDGRKKIENIEAIEAIVDPPGLDEIVFANKDLARKDFEENELGLNQQFPASAPGELRILPDAADFFTERESPEPEAEVEFLDELDAPDAPAPLTLRDLRLKLRFHRADFYLVVAIVVSTLAMVWVLSATPGLGANHKPRLRLWERALISMGLADMPEAAPVQRGNPNISVWVDPKTALYYCAGEDLYGKAPGGHLATQREAQLDQFEPAGRVPCE